MGRRTETADASDVDNPLQLAHQRPIGQAPRTQSWRSEIHKSRSYGFTITIMTDEPGPPWLDTAAKLISTVGAEVLLAPLGVPGLAAGTAIIFERVMTGRRGKGVEHLEFVAHQVGEDKLLGIIQTDEERSEMLWASTQTSMASSHDGKRLYLARVVANAMTSTEPVDIAQLIVTALKELDGPHIRALTVIRKADDANQLDPGNNDEILQAELKRHPYPILAALSRSGVVRIGSEQRGNGLFSIPRADTLSITGVSPFGRELLDDLESVVDSF